MNLSHLYYFRKLAELQHYAQAAKELHITQPSLSNAIGSLERELGVSLFQRTGRNVRLTKYGAEFLEHVDAGLAHIDKGVDVMRSYAGGVGGGNVDVGSIITVQTDYLPKLVTSYRTDVDPAAAFSISEETSVPLMEQLKRGVYDVVFCARGEHEPELSFVPVTAQEVVVVMSERCRLAEKAFLVPEDLRGQRFITYRDSIPLGAAVKRLLEGAGVEDVDYSYLDESILAGFAVNGVEAAVMLDTFFLHTVANAQVRPLYNNERERKRYYHRVWMAYSEKNYRPFCVERFIRYVADAKALGPAEDDQIYID